MVQTAICLVGQSRGQPPHTTAWNDSMGCPRTRLSTLIDQYIADFEFLAQRAGIGVNDPTAIRLFSEGMPFSLAKSCIKLEQPKSFKQWAKAAQAQQRNYILIQGLKRSKDRSSTAKTPLAQNTTCNPFFWRRGGGQQQQNPRP